MTHHTVHVERVTGGWTFNLDGMAVMAPRLCDVEPAARLHLQRRFGDVTEDTIEVKIGGRRRGTSAPDDSKRFINTAGRKRKPRRH